MLSVEVETQGREERWEAEEWVSRPPAADPHTPVSSRLRVCALIITGAPVDLAMYNRAGTAVQ